MSLIIGGNQSNVTTPLVRTVSSIASGTGGVWRVATSAPHLFGSNDLVELQVTISAVSSTVYGFITVIDATHFDVAGTTYTATGTGTATDLALTPQIQVPTDGDSFSLQLSGALSALQAIADRTQFLRYQQVAPPTGTIGGVPGTSILAVAGGVNEFETTPFQDIENDLATIKSGSYATSATVTATGLWSFQGGEQHRTAVLLSDAAHTIDVTADTYVLPNAPASTRLITLSTTSGSPKLGQRIRCLVPGLQGTGQLYQFTRTGGPAGLVAKAFASSVITVLPISVEFEFAPGLILSVTGAASGSGGAVKLTLAFPTGWGSLGNPTDSLATGDQVVVAGTTGTGGFSANGTWTITVNDGTHITLQGSTFAGAWTSGGTAQITPGVWRLGMNSGTSYDGSAQVGLLADGAS